MRTAAFIVLMLLCAPMGWAMDVPSVRIIRLPDAGVQPEAAVDSKGNIHLIYLAGAPAHADIFIIQSTDGGKSFSKPLRVDHHPGSAIALGTVRGAHLAVGKDARIHVAWEGSSQAEPRAAGKAIPMLYTRSSADGLSFETERNVIESHVGLDGGGSIAADEQGNVYITWHAPPKPDAGEQSRRVWLTQSHDDGATFSPEASISADTGACGCCGLRLFTHDGTLHVLYRTADQKIERDMTLLRVDPATDRSVTTTIGKQQSATCVMSTSAMAINPKTGVVGAWETSGQIFWSTLPDKGVLTLGTPAPGQSTRRKHPSIAANQAGQTLLVWTEGTGWNKGGSIAWQIYDVNGKPIERAKGEAPGLAPWGTAAGFVCPDGSFEIAY